MQPQSPGPKSFYFLWIGIIVFIIIVITGIYAIIKHLDTSSAIIVFLLAAIALPFTVKQAIPDLWNYVKQSSRVGLRVFSVFVLLSSIMIIVYLLVHPHVAVSPPLGQTPTPILQQTSIPQLQQAPVLSPPGSTTSNQVSFENPVEAGNLLLVAVTQFKTSVKGVPTDTLHNRYIPVVDPTQPIFANRDDAADYVELYYAVNKTAGSDTITVDFTGLKAKDEEDNNVGIYAFSGLNATAPFDQRALQYGTSNTPYAGDVVVKQARELLFVVGIDCGLDNTRDLHVNSNVTAGEGYSLPEQQPNSTTYERFYAEYRWVTPGVYHTDFTLQYQACWAAVGALFKQ